VFIESLPTQYVSFFCCTEWVCVWCVIEGVCFCVCVRVCTYISISISVYMGVRYIHGCAYTSTYIRIHFCMSQNSLSFGRRCFSDLCLKQVEVVENIVVLHHFSLDLRRVDPRDESHKSLEIPFYIIVLCQLGVA